MNNRKVILTGITSILCILIVIGALGFTKYKNMKNPHNAFEKDLQKQEGSIKGANVDNIDKNTTLGRNIINILLLGVDSTEEREANKMGYRSDALMMVSMNLDTQEVRLISIPRDSYTEIPGRKGKDKINHAMAFGGGPRKKGNQYAVEAVETLLGIKINYYVTMDLDSVKDMVDTIGGVTIDVERDIGFGEKYIIKKGMQRLNGEEALIYLSNRNAPTGDFARIKQQQNFMLSLFQEVKKMAKFTDVLPLYLSFQNKIFTNLNVEQVGAVILFLKDLNPKDIETFTLKGENIMIDGIYYLEVDKDYINEIVENRIANYS